MQAVILAGGLGTRLHPVTKTIPKALVTVQDKTLTEHVLDVLKEAGVDEVFLSIGYMKEKIRAYFQGGEEFGVKMHYVEEDDPLGTGGWLHKIERLQGDFIVVNGDNLLDADLQEMLSFHQKNDATATIALTPVEDVTQYGIAQVERERITGFVEKPSEDEAPSDLANAGYYVFNERVFDLLPDKESFMLEQDVFPRLAKAGELYGFSTDAQWYDTGTFERLEEVNAKWRFEEKR